LHEAEAMDGGGHCHAGEGELGQRRAMTGGSRCQRKREGEGHTPSGSVRGGPSAGFGAGPKVTPAAFLLFLIPFLFSDF
jgi:hypothetical protein